MVPEMWELGRNLTGQENNIEFGKERRL